MFIKPFFFHTQSNRLLLYALKKHRNLQLAWDWPNKKANHPVYGWKVCFLNIDPLNNREASLSHDQNVH